MFYSIVRTNLDKSLRRADKKYMTYSLFSYQEKESPLHRPILRRGYGNQYWFDARLKEDFHIYRTAVNGKVRHEVLIMTGLWTIVPEDHVLISECSYISNFPELEIIPIEHFDYEGECEIIISVRVNGPDDGLEKIIRANKGFVALSLYKYK